MGDALQGDEVSWVQSKVSFQEVDEVDKGKIPIKTEFNKAKDCEGDQVPIFSIGSTSFPY